MQPGREKSGALTWRIRMRLPLSPNQGESNHTSCMLKKRSCMNSIKCSCPVEPWIQAAGFHCSTLPAHHPAISSCSADTLRAWEKENKNIPKKTRAPKKKTYNISPDRLDRHPRGLHWSQTTLVGDPPQLKLIGCEHDTLQSRLWHQDV